MSLLWGRVRTATPLLVPGALLVAVLAALDWWLDDPKTELGYVRALVWPLVVSSIAWWLRRPLQDKVASMLSFEGLGAKVEFARQASNDLVHGLQELQEVVSTVVGDDDPAAAAGEFATGEPGVTTGGVLQHAMGVEQPEEKRRALERALERTVADSATWGYRMALSGHKGNPVPTLVWDWEGGQPRVALTDDVPAPSANAHKLQARTLSTVARIERDIERLERERDTNTLTGVAHSGEHYARSQQIDRLKRHLRDLDPTSPWAS
jgi:hypothetical protein